MCGWVCVYSCSNTIEEIETLDQKIQPVEVAKEIVLYQSDSAIVKMKMKAPQMERFKVNKDSGYVLFPKGFELEFFDRNNVSQSQIKCDSAINYDQSDVVETWNNVYVKNKQGEELKTSHLIWYKAEKKIKSDKSVEIKTKEEVIFGNGIEADEDFSKFKVLKTRGTIKIKQDEVL